MYFLYRSDLKAMKQAIFTNVKNWRYQCGKICLKYRYKIKHFLTLIFGDFFLNWAELLKLLKFNFRN